DSGFFNDVFVHDRTTGVTERASLTPSGAEGNGNSVEPAMSADGELVAFQSTASNLVSNDTNGIQDIFVFDRRIASSDRVSVDSLGNQANQSGCWWVSISGDGQTTSFYGDSDNLVPNDTNGVVDAFVHQICSTVASWSNYGSGFPGSKGIPSLTSS